MKFKQGDKVVVRGDLKVGAVYYNDDNQFYNYFSTNMKKYLGKTATITKITTSGQYALDIDRFNLYTDSMLITPEEEAKQTIEGGRAMMIIEKTDVEKYIDGILEKALAKLPEQLINDALDRGDKARFHELVEEFYPKTEKEEA